MKWFATWMIAASVSAIAAAAVARPATPVDDALPFIAIVLVMLAALTRPAIHIAVPLLLGGSIALADERARLLWFGVVVAIAFASALLSLDRTATKLAPHLIAVSAVLLLRWIPIGEVHFGREIFILAIAIAIVAVLDGAPWSVALAIGAALFTPAFPLRTLLIPAGALVIAVVARFGGGARVALAVPASCVVGVFLLFFAWSGAFARALPIMLRGGPPKLQRMPVAIALRAGESAEVEVPPNGRGLILSGANVPRVKRGTRVGKITPDGTGVTIGDVADWGVLRREHYYASLNGLPRNPGGLIRGYGQTAWIDASGRVVVKPGLVTVTAAPSLPPNAMLQIDAIELAE